MVRDGQDIDGLRHFVYTVHMWDGSIRRLITTWNVETHKPVSPDVPAQLGADYVNVRRMCEGDCNCSLRRD